MCREEIRNARTFPGGLQNEVWEKMSARGNHLARGQPLQTGLGTPVPVCLYWDGKRKICLLPLDSPGWTPGPERSTGWALWQEGMNSGQAQPVGGQPASRVFMKFHYNCINVTVKIPPRGSLAITILSVRLGVLDEGIPRLQKSFLKHSPWRDWEMTAVSPDTYVRKRGDSAFPLNQRGPRSPWSPPIAPSWDQLSSLWITFHAIFKVEDRF